ncbi:MAG: UDP-N-acetylglucosamine 1-carboxyvinyltransferase [Tissierellia bacterium]|nr:UDP-N-acetylglucosamine 1-carboxyvinyltransferase [Tissierellia bacterium]
MKIIRVRKSGPLKGQVEINGAKNSALPILAASLLNPNETIIADVPQLKDVMIMIEVLEALGAKVEYLDDTTLKINAKEIKTTTTPFSLMNKMRASFVVMGPLLARMGRAVNGMPGGCQIGERPIDLHLKGFRALGARVEEKVDRIEVQSPGKLKGSKIYLDFPSVGATQNIMMAAVLAEGETVIENAAKEPEIVDLSNFLSKMGAVIRGAGTSTITIEGVSELRPCEHRIIPDRIEASTFMVAAAMTKGDVLVKNVIASHIRPVIAKLQEMGCEVIEDPDEDNIRVRAKGDLLATNIRTLPYPGFPTDVQAQIMTLMTIAKGQSIVEETVFENRFMHVEELRKMKALIVTEGNEARIMGVPKLVGAQVRATDLRAGASLLIAGLVAEGQTDVYDIYHIERGYYNVVSKFKALGADMELVTIDVE